MSLTQPHIRPIVRGKAGASVEFGAKLSVSYVDGYVRLDHMSWENFNESGDLIGQIEAYKARTGYYPESVHVDKIYRTKGNRAWCRERGIRLTGPRLAIHYSKVSRLLDWPNFWESVAPLLLNVGEHQVLAKGF